MSLWFSYRGRITRSQFWGGLLGLFVVGFFVGLLSAWLAVSMGILGRWIGVGLWLLMLVPLANLSAKRLRDRGRAHIAWWLIAYFAPGVLIKLAQVLSIGFRTQTYESAVITTSTPLGDVLVGIGLVAFLAALIDLGFLKGRENG